MINNKYSRLLILQSPQLIIKNDRKQQVVLCRCDCGVEKLFSVYDIVSGNTKSCGCLKIEKLIARSTKHGLCNHSLFWVLSEIKNRCYNPNHKRYSDYGGRGITVYSAWLNDVKLFYDWAISNGWQKGLQIDRRENDGNYTPDNCRFVSSKVNNNNKRNHLLITYNGMTKNLSEWSVELGLNYSMLLARLKRYNPSPAELFETPNRYIKFKSKK